MHDYGGQEGPRVLINTSFGSTSHNDYYADTQPLCPAKRGGAVLRTAVIINPGACAEGNSLRVPPPKGREKKKGKGEREREREREVASGGGECVIFCTAVQAISNNN